MSTPTLTRAGAIHLLQNNTPFMSFLKNLKAATGYTPEKVEYVDDHDQNITPQRLRRCTDFIAVLRVKSDGSLIQDTPLRDATWIFPGFTSYDWNTTRTQNPLYVNGDGQVHLTWCARGAILRGVGGGSNFDKVIRDQKGVHLLDMSDHDGTEDFEAHIHLTIDELNAL